MLKSRLSTKNRTIGWLQPSLMIVDEGWKYYRPAIEIGLEYWRPGRACCCGGVRANLFTRFRQILTLKE